MFNIFKTNKTASDLYRVTYKFIDEEEIYTTTATVAGLTSLSIDWAIEVIEAVKL